MIEEHNSEASFDLSYLNQVFQGNKQMINQIISMFIKQVPTYFNQMEECIVRAEYSALHPLAHKAKSSIAMLGLKEMETLVLEIERSSKTGQNTEQLAELVKQVNAECSQVKTTLEQIINE